MVSVPVCSVKGRVLTHVSRFKTLLFCPLHDADCSLSLKVSHN